MYFQFVDQLNASPARGKCFFLPYNPTHLDRIEISQPEIIAASQVMDVARMIDNQAEMGPSATAFLDGRPVAVFGMVPIWTGVGEAWMIADDRARERPILMTKLARTVMDILVISQRLRRLQITVRTTDRRAVKWGRAIGFEQEAVLKAYGPDGVDHLMMARWK